MNKTSFILIFMILGSVCNASELVNWKIFFNKGDISIEFWKAEPFGINNKTDSVVYVEDNNLLTLFDACKYEDENGKNARDQLIKMGFPLLIDTESGDSTDLDESNNTVNTHVILLDVIPVEANKRFSLLCLGQDLYLIDTQKPITAYLIPTTNLWGCASIAIKATEKIDENKYRFFLGGFVGNGRLGSEPRVQVHDIDFISKRCSVQHASFANDLDGDGYKELILATEIAWGINWYWVYSYKNGNWVNSSVKFPNYYKTEVKKMMEERKRYADPKVEYICKALIGAAEKGGPSAFVK